MRRRPRICLRADIDSYFPTAHLVNAYEMRCANIIYITKRWEKKTYQIADASIPGDPGAVERTILSANVWIWNCKNIINVHIIITVIIVGDKKKLYANAGCTHNIIAFGNESANKSYEFPKFGHFHLSFVIFLRLCGIEKKKWKWCNQNRRMSQMIWFFALFAIYWCRCFAILPQVFAFRHTYVDADSIWFWFFMLATNTFYAFPMQFP